MKLALFSLLISSAWAFSPVAHINTNAKISTDLPAVSRRDVLGWIPAVAFATLPAVANAAVKDAPKEKTVEKADKTKKPSKEEPTAVAVNGGEVYGVYLDPKHPRGYRVITGSGSKLSMQLQDEPTGKTFSIPIKQSKDKKTKASLLTVDFSPKGGPKNIVGTFDEKGGKITYPDGNVWTKLTGVVGVYSDPNHPKGYRVIRKEGSNFVVSLNDSGSSGKEISIPAKTAGKSIVFDFSSKDGPKNLKGSFKDGVITFPDGNTWTKL